VAFLINIDELERNVLLKIRTKMKLELELEARIVMWRWLTSTFTERVMHQKLKNRLGQVG
jgi:hypothetical protein